MSGDIAAMLTSPALTQCTGMRLGQTPECAIYLDVDGVVAFASRPHVPGNTGVYRFYEQLSPEHCARVVAIVRATGARIVVCSTWRLWPKAMVALKQGLIDAGLGRREIRNCRLDVTGVNSSDLSRHRRWTEVRGHLRCNPEIVNWVWLDDDDGTSGICIEPHTGLQDCHVTATINILRGEFPCTIDL